MRVLVIAAALGGSLACNAGGPSASPSNVDPACRRPVSADPEARLPGGERIPKEQLTMPHLIGQDKGPDPKRFAPPFASGSGLVAVRCILHVDGVVSDCRITCSTPSFDRAVIVNFESMRYSPVTYRGRPVETAYTFSIEVHSLL